MTDGEKQVKHLELIQGVVNRLAQNSFALKGWAVTLVAALFVLADKQADPKFILIIALLPTLAFWGLDAYFLRQERLFRKLYDSIRRASVQEWGENFFSMDTSPFSRNVDAWLDTVLSRTLKWFYGPLAVAIVIVCLLVAGVSTAK